MITIILGRVRRYGEQLKKFIFSSKLSAAAEDAKNAATVAELADACRRLDIADIISLGKINLQLAKYALSAVLQTYKKYPYLRGSVNYFGTLTGYNQNKNALLARLPYAPGLAQAADELAACALEQFQGDGLAFAFSMFCGSDCASGIIINGKLFHCDKVIENLKGCEKIGFHPQGCRSVRSVIDHELGHLLDRRLDVGQSEEYQSFIRAYTVQEIGAGLSTYSVMDGSVYSPEVIAEGYAEYRNNPRPREIALRIGQIIDRQYQEFYK